MRIFDALIGPGAGNRLSRAGFELALIVIGILIALAVDQWREDRASRKLEHAYLLRLADDLTANVDVARSAIRWQAAIARNARLVYPLIRHGTRGDHDDASTVAQAYHATPGPTPSWVDDTFQDLLGTGNLRLLTSHELRAEILAYYRFLKAADYPFELRSHDYRREIRETFDPDLQLAIRQHCDRNEPVCVLPGFDNLDAVIEWMRSNETLARYLTRVITQSTRAEREYLVAVESATEKLLTAVRAELSGTDR